WRLDGLDRGEEALDGAGALHLAFAGPGALGRAIPATRPDGRAASRAARLVLDRLGGELGLDVGLALDARRRRPATAPSRPRLGFRLGLEAPLGFDGPGSGRL